MNNKKNITAIILAGGKSSRMGTDKGFVSYKNKPFVQHIIDVVRPLVNEIIIISNNPNYDIFGLKRFEDLVLDAGPLAGIYTGLHYSESENNLVISCDVPLISSELLELLITEIDTTSEVIQLQSGDKKMPLIAIYKKSCEAKFSEALNLGERRVRKALEQCEVKTIVIKKALEKHTANINTKEDLKEIIE
ncbi:MAG: molybdenum cofactor guanylyltransferase [Flavobacteriaceae bacterium]